MNCRKAVAVVLLMFMALEILPCVCLDASAPATGESGGFMCSIGPLQVCDSGDSLLGALANIPVLVPGATILILSPAIHFLVPDLTSFVPDGFCPSIDHPPQLRA
jgi:hypothetical protein